MSGFEHMLIFAILAAGFGASGAESKPEAELLLPAPANVTLNEPPNHLEHPFEQSPPERGYMVVVQPSGESPDGEAAMRQDGGPRWLEPPGGWVSPSLKSRPHKVHPLTRPALQPDVPTHPAEDMRREGQQR